MRFFVDLPDVPEDSVVAGYAIAVQTLGADGAGVVFFDWQHVGHHTALGLAVSMQHEILGKIRGAV